MTNYIMPGILNHAKELFQISNALPPVNGGDGDGYAGADTEQPVVPGED